MSLRAVSVLLLVASAAAAHNPEKARAAQAHREKNAHARFTRDSWVDGVFMQADDNRDQKVSFEELMIFMETTAAGIGASLNGAVVEDLESFVEDADTDKDGAVSKAELLDPKHKVRLHARHGHIYEMFEGYQDLRQPEGTMPGGHGRDEF